MAGNVDNRYWRAAFRGNEIMQRDVRQSIAKKKKKSAVYMYSQDAFCRSLATITNRWLKVPVYTNYILVHRQKNG